jgi:hypothetical protein
VIAGSFGRSRVADRAGERCQGAATLAVAVVAGRRGKARVPDALEAEAFVDARDRVARRGQEDRARATS